MLFVYILFSFESHYQKRKLLKPVGNSTNFIVNEIKLTLAGYYPICKLEMDLSNEVGRKIHSLC